MKWDFINYLTQKEQRSCRRLPKRDLVKPVSRGGSRKHEQLLKRQTGKGEKCDGRFGSHLGPGKVRGRNE